MQLLWFGQDRSLPKWLIANVDQRATFRVFSYPVRPLTVLLKNFWLLPVGATQVFFLTVVFVSTIARAVV